MAVARMAESVGFRANRFEEVPMLRRMFAIVFTLGTLAGVWSQQVPTRNYTGSALMPILLALDDAKLSGSLELS
jgi:hypothetical protein